MQLWWGGGVRKEEMSEQEGVCVRASGDREEDGKKPLTTWQEYSLALVSLQRCFRSPFLPSDLESPFQGRTLFQVNKDASRCLFSRVFVLMLQTQVGS